MGAEETYGVFIIESMDLENELRGNLDGYTLKGILDLCGIRNEYFYIRTKLEFEKIIEEFKKSKLRFLHIACHGSETELGLTFDSISLIELEGIFGDCLYHKRLFLSACRAATFELAEYFIPRFHCFSVIGTPEDIEYDKAAIFWGSFYYLMYQEDSLQMVQKKIIPTLENVSKTFKVTLNYFSIINNENIQSIDHLKEIRIENGKKTIDKTRKTKYKNQFRLSEL